MNIFDKALNLDGLAKKDLKIETVNVFPQVEGQPTPLCPFMEPNTIPQKGPDKIVMIRLYHPCMSQCRLWDSQKHDCKLV